MPYIKMTGDVRFGDILDVLEIDHIPDCDHRADREFSFDRIDIDSDDMLAALESRGLIPEPEKPEVSVRDLRDGFAYLREGNAALAREMFQRALSECGDDRLMTAIEEICRNFVRAEING